MRKLFLTQFQAVLNETSYGLHRLTQRQGLIKEFDIILPKSWHVPSCEPGRQMTSVQRANPARPDVFIDAKVKQSFYFVFEYSRVPNKTEGNIILFLMFSPPSCPYLGPLV